MSERPIGHILKALDFCSGLIVFALNATLLESAQGHPFAQRILGGIVNRILQTVDNCIAGKACFYLKSEEFVGGRNVFGLNELESEDVATPWLTRCGSTSCRIAAHAGTNTVV